MTTRYKEIRRVTIVSVIINGILATIKILVGLLGSSAAVFDDGIHSLSDLLSDALVFAAGYYSSAEPDESHPYGHYRFETVVTVLLSAIIIVIGVCIGYSAAQHLLHKTYIIPDVYTIWAILLSIVANDGLFRYILKIGNKIDSDMLRANAYHSRSDSLSSFAVLIGLIGSFMGYPFLDSVAAIVVGIFIIKVGMELGWKAIYELTESGVKKEEKQEIENTISVLPGVKQIHQLRTRKLGGKVFLDVHVLIEPDSSASEGHFIAETACVALQNKIKNIEDITVHIDTEDHPECLPDKILSTRGEIIAAYMPKWNKIIKQDHILHLRIFYLEQQIQIEITLALSVLEHHNVADLRQQFMATVQNDKNINRLQILFR